MGDPSSLSVLSLSRSGTKLEVDNSLPLKVYYRTADNLLKQASIYRNENNFIDLYNLLLRFSSLILETIPKHRDYKKLLPKEKTHYTRKLVEVINELELLKPDVQKQLRQLNNSSLSGVEWLPAKSSSLSRFDEQKSMEPPGSFSRQVQAPVRDSMTSNFIKQSNGSPEFMSLRIPKANDDTRSRHSFLTSTGLKTPKMAYSTPVQYPNFIEASTSEITSPAPSSSVYIPSSSVGGKPMPLPLEASSFPRWANTNSSTFQERPSVDQLVAKFPQWAPFNQPFPPPVAVPIQSVPPFDQYPPVTTCGVSPMNGAISTTRMVQDDEIQAKAPKQLHVSLKMMDEFLDVAKLNTQRNLETCGVLSGYLERGVFNITTLIIPKQESTSDSCQTVNEEEIFDIQDKHGLFQLGWIHTHPSQSCFMSSIDLHTHYSYQVMLQEAVAIVMAPTDMTRKFGIFRLSDPVGVKVIQQCQERGFHPHDEPPDGGTIYEHSTHVFINPKLRYEVIDLR